MIGIDFMVGHERRPDCPPLTHCNVGESVGAIATAADILPYALTSLPQSDAELSNLYNNYLKAMDMLIADVYTLRHPIDSAAAKKGLQGARAGAADVWAQGDRRSRTDAVQLLASIMGWFNARFRHADGSYDWDGISGEVDAALTKTATNTLVAAGKMAADTAKKINDAADKAVSAGWGIVKILVYGALGLGVIGVGGYVYFKYSDSGQKYLRASSARARLSADGS